MQNRSRLLPLFACLLPIAASYPARGAEPSTAPAQAAPAQAAPAKPAPAAKISPRTLVEQLRVVYLQPSGFSPAAMRYPLRRDAAAELKRARAEADEKPTDGELRLRVARLAEETEDERAPREWQSVLGLTRAALRERAEDPELQERQVEALVGANVGAPAVAAAEQWVKAKPDSWRAHLLVADAYVRRADGNWRAVARLATDGKAQGSPQLMELSADLASAEREYARAVELAPAEGAPRGGRSALALSRPMMTALLPSGLLPGPAKTDLTAIRADLLDWAAKAPASFAPAWHLAHFLAIHSTAGFAPTEAEREAVEKAALRAPAGEAGFAAEARGLLAVARGEWPAARTQFEAAIAAIPERRLAAGWLALSETRSNEPIAARLERLRARPGAAARAEDQTAIGVLLAETDRTAALETLRGALRLDVDHMGARYALGVLLLESQPDSSEARHHLELIWSAQPEDPEATFAFFVTRLMDGEVEASRHALKELPRFQPLSQEFQARLQGVLTATQAEEAKPPAAK